MDKQARLHLLGLESKEDQIYKAAAAIIGKKQLKKDKKAAITKKIK